MVGGLNRDTELRYTELQGWWVGLNKYTELQGWRVGPEQVYRGTRVVSGTEQVQSLSYKGGGCFGLNS